MVRLRRSTAKEKASHMPKRGDKKPNARRGDRQPPARLRPATPPPLADMQRDPVALIVAQWQRERPDLDPAPMLLFGALARAHLLTTPYLNRILAAHGLVRGTFDVLAALRRAGPPFSLTPKQLSESLMLSGAGMTSRLDRLEALHLIARLPEPNDRRSLRIELTRQGVKLIDEVIPQVIEAQWRVISDLGMKQTTDLISLLGNLTDVLASPGAGASED
jgi:DNA-binding MarR family transcriptional regulator